MATKADKIDAFYSPTDLNDIVKMQASLFSNPYNLRADILRKYGDKTGLKTLSRISTLIVILGPNPDRAYIRVKQRTANILDKDNIALKYVLELNTLLTAIRKEVPNLRGTQFQAALPDLIFASRKVLSTKSWSPQLFVDESVLDPLLQFAGAGPILTTEDEKTGYQTFAEAFSMAISQGKRHANAQIVKASLSWSIDTGAEVKVEDDGLGATKADAAIPKTGVDGPGSRVFVAIPNSLQFGTDLGTAADILRQPVKGEGKEVKPNGGGKKEE